MRNGSPCWLFDLCSFHVIDEPCLWPVDVERDSQPRLCLCQRCCGDRGLQGLQPMFQWESQTTGSSSGSSSSSCHPLEKRNNYSEWAIASGMTCGFSSWPSVWASIRKWEHWVRWYQVTWRPFRCSAFVTKLLKRLLSSIIYVPLINCY